MPGTAFSLIPCFLVDNGIARAKLDDRVAHAGESSVDSGQIRPVLFGEAVIPYGVGVAVMLLCCAVLVGKELAQAGENPLDVVEKKYDNRSNEIIARISESRVVCCNDMSWPQRFTWAGLQAPPGRRNEGENCHP